MQLVTQQNLYRLRIFNKLEVSRLDSRLSSFVIISLYIHTLSWCQGVVGFSRNWENLIAIKLSNKSDTLSWCQRVVGFSKNWENVTAIKLSNKSDTLSWCQRVVRSSRNWEHLTAIRTHHHLVRIQITFKTI